MASCRTSCDSAMTPPSTGASLKVPSVSFSCAPRTRRSLFLRRGQSPPTPRDDYTPRRLSCPPSPVLGIAPLATRSRPHLRQRRSRGYRVKVSLDTRIVRELHR